MAVTAAQVSVGTTATLLSASDTDNISGQALVVKVPSAATAPVFLGPANVTATTGFEVAIGGSISLDLGQGESLYGVAATIQTAHVLRTGV
jgi:hypothetical protein